MDEGKIDLIKCGKIHGLKSLEDNIVSYDKNKIYKGRKFRSGIPTPITLKDIFLEETSGKKRFNNRFLVKSVKISKKDDSFEIIE